MLFGFHFSVYITNPLFGTKKLGEVESFLTSELNSHISLTRLFYPSLGRNCLEIIHLTYLVSNLILMLCVLGNEDDLYAIGYKHILFEKKRKLSAPLWISLAHFFFQILAFLIILDTFEKMPKSVWLNFCLLKNWCTLQTHYSFTKLSNAIDFMVFVLTNCPILFHQYRAC